MYLLVFTLSLANKKHIDVINSMIYVLSKSIFDTSLLFVITVSDNAFQFVARKLDFCCFNN